jgi:glyoxylase-like metal-dependent hydrolase (beta-lactamase superfamily II)
VKQILPRLHTFTGLLLGHVYCIEDGDGLTLIDTGLALAAPKVLRQLQAAGRAPGDVKRILITHAHPDHVGGLPALKAATGAQVICSAIEKPYTEGAAAVLRKGGKPAQPMTGTPVDRTVQDGGVLDDVFDGLRVVATPGHTLGQVAFWQPERRVLICGDTLMNMLRLSLPFGAYTTDMAEARRSVAKVARLEPDVVCFGHGPALTSGAAGKIADFARRVA